MEDQENQGEDFESEPEAQVSNAGYEDGGERRNQGRHDNEPADCLLVDVEGGLGQCHCQQCDAPNERYRAESLQGHDKQYPRFPADQSYAFF